MKLRIDLLYGLVLGPNFYLRLLQRDAADNSSQINFLYSDFFPDELYALLLLLARLIRPVLLTIVAPVFTNASEYILGHALLFFVVEGGEGVLLALQEYFLRLVSLVYFHLLLLVRRVPHFFQHLGTGSVLEYGLGAFWLGVWTRRPNSLFKHLLVLISCFPGRTLCFAIELILFF